MFNWIPLNETALEDYLASDQIALFKQYQANQNPLPNIIRDVCAYIRAFVPDDWQSGQTDKTFIPDTCKHIACVLVIEALQSRIQDLQLSEDQIRNADHARQSLAQLKENWAQQADRRQGHHRIEAVRYRAHDASTKTLRGL